MLRLAAILTLPLLAAPTASSAVRPDDATFQASLMRGPCLGPCPTYTVTVTAFGAVTFVGSPPGRGSPPPCLGEHQWRVSVASVRTLESLIDRSNILSLNENYAASITDQPAYIVTVTRRGRTKVVRDYAGQLVGMPSAVREIEAAIDAAANDRDCMFVKAPARMR